MKALNLSIFPILASLLSLILIGCMPDSVTKFREDAPKKAVTTASGGDSGGSGGGGSSTSGTPATSIVYGLKQQNALAVAAGFPAGDCDSSGSSIDEYVGSKLIIKVTDSTALSSYAAAQPLNAIDPLTLTGALSTRGNFNILVVDTDKEELLIETTSATVTALGGEFLKVGDYIDNCAAGFGQCSFGTATAAQISSISFYLDRTQLNQTCYNLNLSPTTDPASAGPDWSYQIYTGSSNGAYTLAPLPNGMAFDTTTGQITMPVPPFLSPELDNQAFRVEILNADGATNVVSDFSITTVKTNEESLSFGFSNTQRIMIDVEETSGFAQDDYIRSCTSNNISNCGGNPAVTLDYAGRARVLFVDDLRKRLYLKIETDPILDPAATATSFITGHYIHNDNGSSSTKLNFTPTRLFRTTDNFTITATTTATGQFTATPSIHSGLSLNTSTGTVTATAPLSSREGAESEYLITLRSATGEILAEEPLKFIILPPPINVTYSPQSSPFLVTVGGEAISATNYVTGLPTQEIGLQYIIDPVFTNGLSFNNETGAITGEATSFESNANYTVYAFHPATALDNKPIAGDSTGDEFSEQIIQISTASKITDIYPIQSIGRKLILTVSDSDPFTIGEAISTESGGLATITYIDSDKKQIYITLPTSLSGTSIFKDDDKLDAAAGFVSEKALVTKVTNIFDISDNLTTATGTPITFEIYNNSSNVTPLVGEFFTFSFSPSLPSDMTSDITAGTISGLNATGQAALEESSYSVTARSSIGEVVGTTFNIIISETPKDLTIAQMQYVPLNPAVASGRFYKGTRIAASGDDSPTGKVFDVYTNSSGQTEGLLVEMSHKLLPNQGIDNEGLYFAAESNKDNFQYIYISNLTLANFTPGEYIVSAQNDIAKILSRDVESGRLMIQVFDGSTFTAGESIDHVPSSSSTFTTSEDTISSLSDDLSVTAVFNLVEGNGANFTPGSYVTSSSAKGLVIWTDTVSNPDRIYVRTISGEFSNGDSLDNTEIFAGAADGTLANIEAPYLKLQLSAADPQLVAGKNITARTGLAFSAAGSIMSKNSSVDTSTDTIYIRTESGLFSAADGVDDTTPHSAVDEQTITNTLTTNNLYLYVGDNYHLQTSLRGTVDIFSISPPLPDGLSLNSTTGAITGTPTEPSIIKNYTIIARDGALAISKSFNLEVSNQFYLYQETPDTSSYITHKAGQGLRTADCRITSNQINGADTDGVNDITCLMEGDEGDLYNSGLQFKLRSGAGLCEYVRYRPYGINTFPIQTTNAEYHNYQVAGDATLCSSWTGDGIGTAIIPAEATSDAPKNGFLWGSNNFYCQGNSQSCTVGNLPSKPQCVGDWNEGSNCDAGSYTLKTYTCTAPTSGSPPASCNCVMVPTDVACDGDAKACIGGGIIDHLEGDQLDISSSSLTYAFSGIDSSDYKIESPRDTHQKASTAHVANYTRMNSCLTNNNYLYDADLWSSYSGNTVTTTNSSIAGNDPHSGYRTNPFYTFECVDSADNIKARIRVIVRDWDLTVGPNDTIDDMSNDSGKMDSNSICFGSPCNSRSDIDDFAMAGANPNISACGSHDGGVIPSGSANVDITIDDTVITCSGGGCSYTTELTIGSAVNILGVVYLVDDVISNTEFSVVRPPTQTTTATPLIIYGTYPYPMDR